MVKQNAFLWLQSLEQQACLDNGFGNTPGRGHTVNQHRMRTQLV